MRLARLVTAVALLAVLAAAAVLLRLLWTGQTSEQTIRFSPSTAPISNPLMGWAPHASLANIPQPHTLVYADLTWRDFEPQPGVFDFEGFERRQQLERWRAQGQRVVFRFVCDVPGPDAHRDIPDWLYEATGGSGDSYDTSYGKGFSPDYTNPLFIQYHRSAIGALGRRYGHDGFFAFVELGSLGHWGEWHVASGAGIQDLPPKAIRDQYVEHYRAAFPDTPLLMRRPFSIAGQFGLGLYNDLSGEPAGTREWLGWIAGGGDYDQTREGGELVPMPDAWETAPIGGEQTGTLTMQQLYRDQLPETLRLLEASHATFIGPRGPAGLHVGDPLQAGIDQVLSRMGYRLYVQEVSLPRRVFMRDRVDVRMVLANDGIAPFYFDWPVEVYLLDERGDVRSSVPADVDLRRILPEQPVAFSASLPLAGLPDGSYQLGVAILDPATQKPAVRLAMQNARDDLIQVLGSVQVLWSPR